MSPMDADGVLKVVKDEGVDFIRLLFTDIFGTPKNVEIPAAKLEGVFDKGMAFDGSSIEGFVRISESDMYLNPDASSFAIHPWSEEWEGEKTAHIICDVVSPDGTPFAGDPRYSLRRSIAAAEKHNFEMFAGAEAEFFLFRMDEFGKPMVELHDRGGYFDLTPVDLGDETRKAIVIALERMGFEIEAAHHEVAPSQHEINFKFSDVLTTADNIVTFRFVVKKIAMQHGLYATFMPKPISGVNGSGMHSNISLFSGGNNAFYDSNDHYHLSGVARNFIGGVIEHIGAITSIANPLVNSYKRLVPGYEAPVNICWARKNRSALIRVPDTNTPEVSTRIELRSPDPSANPYLLYASILSAGLDGIEKSTMPPDPIEENIYEMTESERSDRLIGTLPGTLTDSIAELASCDVIKSALGSHVMEKYVAAKRQEIEGYRLAVSQWELDEYLARY